MSNKQSAEQGRWIPHLGTFWTIPNVLSLIRLGLVGPIAYLIVVNGPKSWLFGLLAFAVVTDWIDGRLARWSHTVSDWGKVLDPVADKVAAAAVVLALVLRQQPPNLPVWFLAVIVVRDALIVLGGIILTRRTRQVFMSIWFGKIAVAALTVTVLAALLEADPPILRFCIWATTALLTYAFILYAIRFMRALRAGTPLPKAVLDGEEGRTVATVQPERSVESDDRLAQRT